MLQLSFSGCLDALLLSFLVHVHDDAGDEMMSLYDN